MEEEIRAHLRMAVEERVARGESRSDAERAAEREFGNIERVKETIRDVWPWTWLDRLVMDLREAVRSLSRRPWHAVGIALTLGLGIGATTTIYSVVDGVMIRPLPYEEPSTLVTLGAISGQGGRTTEETGVLDLGPITMASYRGLRERSRAFDELAAIERTNVFLPDTGDGPERVAAVLASSELFELLGAAPAVGRTFLPQEHLADSEGVALITNGSWMRRYGGDPGVLGRSLQTVGRPLTIVGVLPRDFRPPEALFSNAEQPELWLPLQPGHRRYERPRAVLELLGRLRPEVSVDQVRREAVQIATQLAVELPENRHADGSAIELGVNDLHMQTIGSSRRELMVFLGAAGLLLLLAVMNATTLLLARSLERNREIGVRMALGGSRFRIVRLLVSDAGLLSLASGAVGILFAFAGVAAFIHYAPSSIPRQSDVAVNARVLGVAALVSLGAGIVAGLLSALRLTRRGPWGRLQQTRQDLAEPTSRLRTVLVTGQLAVAVVLLAGAGLLFGSFLRLRAVEPGFEPEHLFSMRVGIEGAARAGPAAGKIRASWQGWAHLQEELSAVPGLEALAGATALPFQTPTWLPRLLLPGDSPQTWRQGIAGYAVTPGYFEALKTRVLRGRGIEPLDGPESEPVVVVNDSFVRSQLGGDDPIGMTLRRSESAEETPMRVVGVVEDVVQARAEDGPRPAIYVPYTQYQGPLQVVVRTALPPESIVPALRRAVARFNPIQPPEDIGWMTDRIAAARVTPRFQTMLLTAFALAALLVAAAGLYGLLAHSVGQRTRELGIRMALGAERGTVLRMVLGEGMWVSMTGLSLGLAVALAVTRVLAGLLYRIEAQDPVTFLIVSSILASVAAVACLAPARRATGVDPATVLK